MGRRQNDRAPVPDELDLHQLTVDEALIALDRYLNDAFVAGRYQVKIIHGKGSGTLHRLVQHHLHGHPLVSSYRPGGYGEGSGGVTVVELAAK